jgi:hypothetical protein
MDEYEMAFKIADSARALSQETQRLLQQHIAVERQSPHKETPGSRIKAEG